MKKPNLFEAQCSYMEPLYRFQLDNRGWHKKNKVIAYNILIAIQHVGRMAGSCKNVIVNVPRVLHSPDITLMYKVT